MPPKAKKCTSEINLYWRVAVQRFEEAQILHGEHDLGTAAVYLAGYSVECALKALLLSTYPAGRCKKVIESFRGKAGHDFESLKAKYLRRPNATTFPSALIGSFSVVRSWDTELRYKPGVTPAAEVKRFLAAVEQIMTWTKGNF